MVTREYLSAETAVVVVLLEMLFKLFRVIEVFVTTLTIVVSSTRSPVLLKTTLCCKVLVATDVVIGRISLMHIKSPFAIEVPIATVAVGHWG